MVDRMAPPRTVLCIPTDALSVNDLASFTYRAEGCVGLKWIGDAVLLISGRRTSAETISLTEEFWRSLGYAVTTELDSSVLG